MAERTDRSPAPRRPDVAIAIAFLLASAAPAYAQRTDDNPVDDAADAFGTTVGNESIGIYSTEDVRGFSPEAAGNVRVEGLYVDQQISLTSRILDGSSVHVGISAQGYPFPAPTGIADFELRKPGKETIISPTLGVGPYGSRSAELDALVALRGDVLGVVAGLGLFRDRGGNGSTSRSLNSAVSLRFAPSSASSVQIFVDGFTTRDEESSSLIFSSGDFLPRRIRRGRFFGQRWADFNGYGLNYGLVAKTKLAGFELGLGASRSSVTSQTDDIDLLRDVDRDGTVGQRIVVRDRDNRNASTSGEVKLTRSFNDGSREHLIHATARARAVSRRYGGSAEIDLGASRTGVEDFRPEPLTITGEKTRDRVSQTTFGIGYELRWAKRGEISIGVQKTDYAKRVTDPAGVVVRSTDAPFLPSVTAALRLGGGFTLYGGHVRGLEESDVAPSDAENRNEAPPAIRTKQSDFGARWAITPKLSAVLGWFSIEKPYYNLDSANFFRRLGAQQNSGLEFSLSGKVTPRLTVVTGALYLDSKISGEEVASGAIGRRPIGWIKLRTSTNINWSLPWHDPLTLTAGIETAASRTANAANTFVVPARGIFNLGARYKFQIAGKPLLAIADVGNVFNTFGWGVGGSGFFVPNGQRRFSFSLAADL